jgi:hypothetical protein
MSTADISFSSFNSLLVFSEDAVLHGASRPLNAGALSSQHFRSGIADPDLLLFQVFKVFVIQLIT